MIDNIPSASGFQLAVDRDTRCLPPPVAMDISGSAVTVNCPRPQLQVVVDHHQGVPMPMNTGLPIAAAGLQPLIVSYYGKPAIGCNNPLYS